MQDEYDELGVWKVVKLGAWRDEGWEESTAFTGSTVKVNRAILIFAQLISPGL